MRVRFPLWIQIISFLLLHLLLISGILLIVFKLNLGTGIGSLIEGPVLEHFGTLGWTLNRQTSAAPREAWNQILDDYGKVFGIELYVFDNNGQQIAGKQVTLPPEVKEKIILALPRRPLFGAVPFGRFGLRNSDDRDESRRLNVPPDTARLDGPPPGPPPRTPRPDEAPDAMPPHAASQSAALPDAMPPHAPPSDVIEFKPSHHVVRRNSRISEAEPAGELPIPNMRRALPDLARTKSLEQEDAELRSHEGNFIAPNIRKNNTFSLENDRPNRVLKEPFEAPHNHLRIIENGNTFTVRAPAGTFPPMPTRPDFLMRTSNPSRFWLGTPFPIHTQHGMQIHIAAGAPYKIVTSEGVHLSLNNRTRIQPALLLASTDNVFQSKLFVNVNFVLTIIVSVLGITLLIWLPFALRLTKRLFELTAATEKISNGQFDIKLKGSNFDEIGQLAETVNVMSERLNNFVLGQRRFLGDIAHELCTPVARLQMAIALLEDSEPERQGRILDDVKEEVEDMSALVQELLSFSKASIQGSEIEYESIKLNNMIDEVVERVGASALATVWMPANVEVTAEPTLLKRAIANVVRNSVRYAGDSGPIEIACTIENKFAVLTISDSGPGVPEDAIKLLGEPFYRPEPSRDRRSGGVGLGLAIVKTCIERCNGTFAVRNRKPSGLVVTMKIPRTQEQTTSQQATFTEA